MGFTLRHENWVAGLSCLRRERKLTAEDGESAEGEI